jgi:hypothetical protein
VGTVNQKFSEQFIRDHDRIPVIKGARQFLHGRRVAEGYERKTLLFRRDGALWGIC